MATIRRSINSALKMLGVVGGHGQSATDEELADCLDTLHGLYHGIITRGMIGRMRDVIPDGDYVAGENQRVFRRANAEQIIKIPDLVSGCGSYGYCIGSIPAGGTVTRLPTTDYGRLPTRTRIGSEYRTIRDLSVVVINDEVSGKTDELIYDASQKKWFLISEYDRELDLENENDKRFFDYIMDAEAPLSHRDSIGFRSWIATKLARMFSVNIAEVDPTLMLDARRFEAALALRWGESLDCFIDPLSATSVQPNTFDETPVEEPVEDENAASIIELDIDAITKVDTGTTVNTLRLIVAGETAGTTLFSVTSVNGIFTFSAANAAALGNKIWPWKIEDTSSGQIEEYGYIKAVGLDT
ncbi:MAG: hypothetical protein EOO77_07920 [Oxalobacteraceae bacterium]|nr:MAG: hypothetical protein EOO77_07920 [Oxalobacteraceae bacterium]